MSVRTQRTDAVLFPRPENGKITFHITGGVEVMRLDPQGMTYKGQRIEDAGEAYRAFMEVMEKMKAAK